MDTAGRGWIFQHATGNNTGTNAFSITNEGKIWANSDATIGGTVYWGSGNSNEANTAYAHSQTAHAPSNANYIADNSANWNTAYGWGNHASAGYWSTASTGLAGTNRISTVTDWNHSKPSGFYQASGGSNAPIGSWVNVINVRHSNTANDHGFQLAMGYYQNDLWVRSYQGGTGNNNGTFATWAKCWSTVNDGAGSGLDADLLDGNHASAFAVTGHTHEYLQTGSNTLSFQHTNELNTSYDGYLHVQWDRGSLNLVNSKLTIPRGGTPQIDGNNILHAGNFSTYSSPVGHTQS